MIQYLVSALSPFSNVNPIFAVNVVKISQDSWFYFTVGKSHFGWETANGAKVWLYIQAPFGAISCSRNLLFPPDLCAPRRSADGSHRHPSRHQCCGQALQNHDQDTKDIQRLSFLDMVRVTLARYHWPKTSTVCWAQPYQFFEKILQSV